MLKSMKNVCSLWLFTMDDYKWLQYAIVMRNGMALFVFFCFTEMQLFSPCSPRMTWNLQYRPTSSQFMEILLPLNSRSAITGMCQQIRSIIVHDWRLFCPDIWNYFRQRCFPLFMLKLHPFKSYLSHGPLAYALYSWNLNTKTKTHLKKKPKTKKDTKQK